MTRWPVGSNGSQPCWTRFWPGGRRGSPFRLPRAGWARGCLHAAIAGRVRDDGIAGVHLHRGGQGGYPAVCRVPALRDRDSRVPGAMGVPVLPRAGDQAEQPGRDRRPGRASLPVGPADAGGIPYRPPPTTSIPTRQPCGPTTTTRSGTQWRCTSGIIAAAVFHSWLPLSSARHLAFHFATQPWLTSNTSATVFMLAPSFSNIRLATASCSSVNCDVAPK